MTDDNETNDSQQEFFLPQLSPQPLPSIPKLSRHSGSLTNLSEPNLRREHKPTQSSLHIEGSSRQRPGLPLTPSSATSSVSQTITPVEGAYISEEQLKKEYFSSAFNAISVLHEICSQMPEVRVCLRPLKDIHRCFVRTHEKFIFPEEYSTVRGAAGAQLSTIKIDPATLNQEEVVAFEEDTIEICNT
ncbi:unnamed protein product [Allacma fusca]|uniref:Uncharacterized protein n=1 Tax=Allacma fusca TaxID=39272 RepID=A0A8J2PUQ9_9HEXA|nr:unnamed protein product [Allacma fusca]